MTVIRQIDIDARSGGWISAKQGELLRVIDIEGTQVADMFAVCDDDRTEWLSAGNTRAATRRLFPIVGESWVTTRFRPILTFVDDQSPGVHDMLYRSCDPYMYAYRGAVGYHANCHDNFVAAATDAGWAMSSVPDPVNFFQNTPVSADGRILPKLGVTEAGDAVVLRAEIDLTMVVTACAMDLRRSTVRCAPASDSRSSPMFDGRPSRRSTDRVTVGRQEPLI